MKDKQSNRPNKLVIFQSKEIRRTWHEDEWYYSVVDIVAALTDSPTPRQYWGKVKQREFVKIELSPVWVQLKLPAKDGKLRQTDCANTEGVFRIIQSIPSPKAEPFKRWLAKVGYEGIEEIENPELAQERMKEIYEKKGYPKDWIDKRLRGIAIRQNLTDKWKERGIEEQRDFAILTAEISKATFGMTPGEYKNLWVNNHGHVLRFKNMVSQKFVALYLNSTNLDDFISGMAQPKSILKKAFNGELTEKEIAL